MDLQSKLEFASASLRRKLFDQQITLTGKATKVMRVKMKINDYGDAGETKIVSNGIVECYLEYPGEIPLTRSRKDEAFDQASNPHLYLFDILPISLYTKFSDNIEKYDFIIDKVLDEHGNAIKFVLQVSEMVGTFRSSILWKKSQCAPYNGPIDSQLQAMIDAY